MSDANTNGGWVIAVSFLLAFLATTIPWPEPLAPFRPDWVALTLIYWCMMLPQRVGVGTGWLTGLLVDAGRGALLGQHALAFATVAYLTLQGHQRLRGFSPWRQMLSVLVFLGLAQILIFWISGVIGYPPRDAWYLAPAAGGMAIWPLLFLLLRDVQRYFNVR